MHDKDPDESSMLRGAERGHAAWRELVERHLGRILAFASRTIGERAEAEDIAQEVFARLWTHAKGWRPGPGRVTTWLHRIALNLCLDYRARMRQERLDAIPEPIDP